MSKTSKRDLRPTDSSIVPRYAGPSTFLRLPLTDDWTDLDIAIFGVPTDQGLSSRTGTRHGPSAIREGSRLIRSHNFGTRTSPYDSVNAADVGDVEVDVYDLGKTLGNVQDFVKRLRKQNIMPFAIGGDHCVPLATLRGLYEGEPLGLLQFDAHPDTNDDFYGNKENHATALRRLHEEGVIAADRVVQLGLRGTQFSSNDAEYGEKAGFEIIDIDRFRDLGVKKTVSLIREIMGDKPYYITFDLDGLDPTELPGTPALEPGGLYMYECQHLIRGLNGTNVIGADICELAPDLEMGGIRSAVNAANLLFEILCIMATNRV